MTIGLVVMSGLVFLGDVWLTSVDLAGNRGELLGSMLHAKESPR